MTPRPFNSYDLLKCLAIASMVLDHAGLYLLAQDPWLRALGKLAFPIFVFLVGYSGKFCFDGRLLVCAAAVQAVMWAHADGWHLLTILFSLWLVRWGLSPLVVRQFVLAQPAVVFAGLWLVLPLSLQWLDFGAMAAMLAVAGLLRREQQQGMAARVGSISSMVLVTVVQVGAVPVVPGAAGLLAPGLAMLLLLMVWWALWHIRLEPWDAPKHPWLQGWPCWVARHSLEIYAVHIIGFMAASRLMS